MSPDYPGRFKAWVCDLLELRVLIPLRNVRLSLQIALYCQAEFSSTGRSLIQRSSTECGVSQCDLETSQLRRPRPQ